MINKITLMLFIFCFVFTVETQAGSTGSRQIRSVGCHMHDDICFIHLVGDAFGPEDCHRNEARWLRSSPNGENILAMLTAAFISRRPVNIEFDSEDCFPPMPALPQINWINLY